MKIVYYGNTLNRHQAYLADALYDITNGDYKYIETVPPTSANKTEGKKAVERSYVFRAYESQETWQEAIRMAKDADVALFGACSLQFEVARMNLNEPGLAFEVSERWLKRGWVNLFSPRLLSNMWHYHVGRWKKKPIYKLCSSAYGAGDQYKLFSFKDRCYKWGYFTNVVDALDVRRLHREANPEITSIMWCGRFLKWKHPEIALKLAYRLKESGYFFILNMYGDGEEFSHAQALVEQLGIQDVVRFKGNRSNDEIQESMRHSDIFLFTSDQREGWGAVVNEAMSNGSVVVASSAVGSAPFLVKDGINGFVFNLNDLDSLFEKVTYLILHPREREQMGSNAYSSMLHIWSPQRASLNLLTLISDLQKGDDTSIVEGPCSKAIELY